MYGDGFRTWAPVKSIVTSKQVTIGFTNLPGGYYVYINNLWPKYVLKWALGNRNLRKNLIKLTFVSVHVEFEGFAVLFELLKVLNGVKKLNGAFAHFVMLSKKAILACHPVTSTWCCTEWESWVTIVLELLCRIVAQAPLVVVRRCVSIWLQAWQPCRSRQVFFSSCHFLL